MTTDFRRCLCIHPKRTNYRAPFRNVFPVSISPKIYSSQYSVVSGGAGETFYNIKFFIPAHEQKRRRNDFLKPFEWRNMVFGNGFPFPVTWVFDAWSSLNGSLASTGAGDEIHNNTQRNSFMVSQLGNRGFVGWLFWWSVYFRFAGNLWNRFSSSQFLVDVFYYYVCCQFNPILWKNDFYRDVIHLPISPSFDLSFAY